MLNQKALSLGLAITMEALYIVCAFFFYIMPEWTLYFFNTLVHGVDLTKAASTKGTSFSDFVIGFLSVFVISYLAGVLFTALYNALNKGSAFKGGGHGD